MLILDNYDSFSNNITYIIRELSINVYIIRNSKISLKKVELYNKILLSSGLGIPSKTGVLSPLIRHFDPTKNIFGVCLSKQAIGEAFRYTLINLSKVYHGLENTIKPPQKTFFLQDLIVSFAQDVIIRKLL